MSFNWAFNQQISAFWLCVRKPYVAWTWANSGTLILVCPNTILWKVQILNFASWTCILIFTFFTPFLVNYWFCRSHAVSMHSIIFSSGTVFNACKYFSATYIFKYFFINWHFVGSWGNFNTRFLDFFSDLFLTNISHPLKLDEAYDRDIWYAWSSKTDNHDLLHCWLRLSHLHQVDSRLLYWPAIRHQLLWVTNGMMSWLRVFFVISKTFAAL